MSKMEGQRDDTSYRCCKMRKFLHIEMAAGGKCHFFLESNKIIRKAD